jgi:hypothetical protein
LVRRTVAVAEGLSGGLVEIRGPSVTCATGGGVVVAPDPVELAGPPVRGTLRYYSAKPVEIGRGPRLARTASMTQRDRKNIRDPLFTWSKTGYISGV